MATVKFEDLALQYVLSDEPLQARIAAQTAASMVEASANTRVSVSQFVLSINRWMTLPDSSDDGYVEIADSQEGDLIGRVKALDFLASTLEVLKRDTLKSDQVQLMVSFFCSLFSSDHRAGITAATKGLRQLTTMKNFKPRIGNEIIEGVGKLGDDFKLQAPVTRLEIYQLVLGLFKDQSISKDLEERHGNSCGFMTKLLEICKNERDPNNLMKWFEALKVFLQSFSPSDEVTSEVFKTFSAYFPISLRASATPSGITAEDLKVSLRSCFAAHHRLASHTISYLVAKLDQGDAVTVAVKLDILQTLEACIASYAHAKLSISPYADQIWGSLKYEVRNGEVPETIEATLKVISSLTRRLDPDDLKSFFTTTWRDLAEDIANPAYAAQAGKLLVAILGANIESFSMITVAFTHLQNTVMSSKSAAHQRDMVALLNSILLVRSYLAVNTFVLQPLENPLRDELFGDKIFFDIYLPLWDTLSGHLSAEQVETLKKVMEGLAALVTQQSFEAEPHRLITNATCQDIFNRLSKLAIMYPLEGKSSIDATRTDYDEELFQSAVAALQKAVPQYPQGFQQLVLLYHDSVQRIYQERPCSDDFLREVRQVASTLCGIAYSSDQETVLPLSDYMSLIHHFLDGFLWMLEQQAHPQYWTTFIYSIYLAMSNSFHAVEAEYTQTNSKPRFLFAESYAKLSVIYESALQTEHHKQGIGRSIAEAVKNRELSGFDQFQQIISFCLCVLKQLYRRFTVKYPFSGESESWVYGLHKDFVPENETLERDQDTCLYQLGQLAALIIGELNEDEQKALQLDQEAFRLFHGEAEPLHGIKDLVETVNHNGASNIYRIAPLSMGIFQGLYPGALDHELHMLTVRTLIKNLILMPSLPRSEINRLAWDSSLMILSNKLVIKGSECRSDWLGLQAEIGAAFEKMLSRSGSKEETTRIFRSILCFLHGDIVRFQADPLMNSLLRLVWDKAPADPIIGRELAREFVILLRPAEYLDKMFHAIHKRLAEIWLYYLLVKPYLGKCFPEGRSIQEAVNRSIAMFAVLKYAKYEHYADDVAQIVRIAAWSLNSLEPEHEVPHCLRVLLTILEKEPEALKDHLAGLIKGLVGVYEKAKTTAARLARERTAEDSESDKIKVQSRTKELGLCRQLILEFLQKLPSLYEAHTLLPHRQHLRRPLSQSCGDPVREIRRIALVARKVWDDLA